VVFILAIPLLGEVITLVKVCLCTLLLVFKCCLQVISLTMSVGGACMVGVYSNEHDSSNNTDSITAEWNIATVVTRTSAASHDKTTPLGIMVCNITTLFTYSRTSFIRISSKPNGAGVVRVANC